MNNLPLELYVHIGSKTREQQVLALKRVIQDLQSGAVRGDVSGPAFECNWHLRTKADPEAIS